MAGFPLQPKSVNGLLKGIFAADAYIIWPSTEDRSLIMALTNGPDCLSASLLECKLG